MRSYTPKKSFGQNFLQDEGLLSRIADAICSLRTSNETPVYEIGAGLGALTKSLLVKGAIVHAIERDRDLIPILQNTFLSQIDAGKLILHEANATTFFESSPESQPFVLSGNLPYHLSGTLFFETARIFDQILGAVYLIQKEVADRIAAGPHSKTYGLLSVLLQSRFDISIIEVVAPEVFWPPPKVESSVICLRPKANPFRGDWDKFVHLVKAAFSMRRKVLTNSLSEYENIESILLNLNINPKSRAEDLEHTDYERILACL
ncbi:MAG: 16S rRNA (adenine(1518)-N(6)/adenine(1519)-N(6))-dimethyltransferase RsmA [Myxococcota bacterium]